MIRSVKIKVIDVGKEFEATDLTSAVRAIEKIDLEIYEGEFIALIGPSGCGKSTFLYLVAGFERPTRGQILIDGEPTSKPSPNRGIVFQEYVLFPWRTVEDNICFGLEIQGVRREKRKKSFEYLLDLIGLRGFETAYPHTLSGGMQQRVAIARALAYDPEVLLMDEPFGALDAQTKRRMVDDFVRIWEMTKKTVLFVTHSVQEALALADRIFLFSARPAIVKEVIEVKIPRPRDTASPEYAAIEKRLLQSLDVEVEKMIQLTKSL
jgi:NitT/TauT family transport system ATP-binding protein